METKIREQTARADWEKWRKEQDESLSEPHGWLTVSSLSWLTAEPHPVDSFPGVWSYDGEYVHAQFAKDDEVTLDGQPAVGEYKIRVDADPMPQFTKGVKVMEIAPRGDRIILRVRDNEAALRKAFTGVPTYDYEPAWVVPVDYRRYEEPRKRDILTAQKGFVRRMAFSGEAKMRLDGQTYHVCVTDAEKPFVIFTDKTSGKESAAWRSAPLRKTDDGWAIDFNYASNFPAHYTPFGVCPRPVAENMLDVAIPAGQRKPNETYESVNS